MSRFGCIGVTIAVIDIRLTCWILAGERKMSPRTCKTPTRSTRYYCDNWSCMAWETCSHDAGNQWFPHLNECIRFWPVDLGSGSQLCSVHAMADRTVESEVLAGLGGSSLHHVMGLESKDNSKRDYFDAHAIEIVASIVHKSCIVIHLSHEWHFRLTLNLLWCLLNFLQSFSDVLDLFLTGS